LAVTTCRIRKIWAQCWTSCGTRSSLRELLLVYGRDGKPGADGVPLPQSPEELWQDEFRREVGTHSILDVFRVLGPDEDAGSSAYGAGCQIVKPVSADEAYERLGIRTPTGDTAPGTDESHGGAHADAAAGSGASRTEQEMLPLVIGGLKLSEMPPDPSERGRTAQVAVGEESVRCG
jgi:hypothetical protein